VDKLILSKKVILCAGTGGVGKTTISAALGVRAAILGRKVLVLTVDPAQRLATALGINRLQSEDLLVPNQNFPGKLYAAVVESQSVFDSFIRENIKSESLVKKILRNRIYLRLSTGFSGSQEFTALERFLKSYTSEKYDLIILDTPPTGHAINFLDGAAKLEALFQDSVVKWFMKPIGNQNILLSFVSRGTNLAFKALEMITGAEFVTELVEFFSDVFGLKDILVQRMKKVREIFAQQDSAFVLVTSFDSLKMNEAKIFREELMSRGFELSAVIVNRCFPETKAEEIPPKVRPYYQALQKFYQVHREALASLKTTVGTGVEFIEVSDFDQEVYDLKSLEELSRAL